MCNYRGGVQLGAAPIKLPGSPLCISEQCSPRRCRKLVLTMNYYTAHGLCFSQLLRTCLLYWAPRKAHNAFDSTLPDIYFWTESEGIKLLIATVLMSVITNESLRGECGEHPLDSLKGLMRAWDLKNGSAAPAPPQEKIF